MLAPDFSEVQFDDTLQEQSEKSVNFEQYDKKTILLVISLIGLGVMVMLTTKSK